MPGSPTADPSRPPLGQSALRRALVAPHGRWTQLSVVPETGSTNADVIAAARAGAPAGLVIVAESQTAGRGRLGRHWVAPARAAITVSVLLRPGPRVPPHRLAWLSLLAGVALAESVGRTAVVDTALKWPNDLLVRPQSAAIRLRAAGGEPGPPSEILPRGAVTSYRKVAEKETFGYAKCAGVLAEAVPGPVVGGGEPPAVVLGIGLNVSQRADELPGQADPAGFAATSLALAGATGADRDRLLVGLLRTLESWYDRFVDADGDPHASGLREEYRARCASLGSDVAATLPGGAVVEGRAIDVDPGGRLVLAGAGGPLALAAGDVRHLRTVRTVLGAHP